MRLLEKKNWDVHGCDPSAESIVARKKFKNTKLKKTKKGSLSTSANILEDLAYSGHKFPNLVLTWRQLSKLKNTYTDALQTHINFNSLFKINETITHTSTHW